MKSILIYGFGSYGREVACIINAINRVTPTWNLIGYIDDKAEVGESNRYGKVLGCIDYLNAYEQEIAVIMAIASPKALQKITSNITNPNVSFPNIIAPNVLFFDEDSVRMGKGNLLGFGCRMSCDVKIGDFNLLNGCTSFGHDVSIGNFNITQPDVRLSGMVGVGDANYFAARSLVLPRINIGSNTRIGAGSVVIRKTKDGSLYWGNPAKLMKE